MEDISLKDSGEGAAGGAGGADGFVELEGACVGVGIARDAEGVGVEGGGAGFGEQGGEREADFADVGDAGGKGGLNLAGEDERG